MKLAGWKCAALSACLLAAPCVAGVEAGPDPIDRAIRAKLNLDSYTMQTLALPADLDRGFQVPVTLGGQARVLVLEPTTVRAADFKVLVRGGDGQLRPIPAPPEHTYRGFIDGLAGTVVSATMHNGSLRASILDGTGHAWNIQPVSDAVPGFDPARHVVFHDLDSGPIAGICGINPGNERRLIDRADAGGGGSQRGGFNICELACEADFEFYQANGSSVDNTIADMQLIVTNIAAIYEGECNTTFVITEVIVNSNVNDPYTSSDPDTLLNQFRNNWNANHTDIHRDLAHLFTGRNVDGSVIGIAFLSVVCSQTQGYGLVQSRFSGNLNQRRALSAHEIGHNFSAGHCDGQNPCKIMCSALGGCDGLGNPATFGSISATTITNYANNRPCLDDGTNAIDLPFFDDFPTTVINQGLWSLITGATSTTVASNEPSPPNSLNLDTADSITSVIVRMSALTGLDGHISFYTERIGVDAGETLTVQYLNNVGVWTNLLVLSGDGFSQNSFEFHDFDVPTDAKHDLFQLRFVAAGNEANDDWFIDDITIEERPFAGFSIPFSEDWPTTTPDSLKWPVITGGLVNSNAIGEPSSPNSMNLDNADSFESNIIRLAGESGVVARFFVERNGGVEAGEALVVDYRNSSGVFQNLATVLSESIASNVFVEFELPIPANGYSDNFALRFTSTSNEAADDWFVDDIFVGQGTGGCASDCDGDTICDEDELDGNDCNGNLVPDDCELAGDDCNGNGLLDSCESLTDCDANGTPDVCELAGNDCNGNGQLDSCETLADCDGNGTPDECDANFCAADLAPPQGILNVFDFLAFQSYFSEGAACADLAAPFGSLNVFDFLEFQNVFGGGC